MLEFNNTIRIKRPIADVFTFLADFENIPKWNYFVLKVTKVSEGPIRIGTLYHQIRKTDQQDFLITSLEQNHMVTVKTLPQSFPSFEIKFILHGEGDTTEIRDEWKLESSLPPLLERLATGKVKSAVAENLTKLKELLEEGHVVLQDGRQTTA